MESRTLSVVVTLDPRVEALRDALPQRPARLHVVGRDGATLAVHDMWLDEERSLVLPPGGAHVYARLGELETVRYKFEENAEDTADELFWTDRHELELMRWAAIRVRVCTPAGAPIAGVAVHLDTRTAATDAVGVVELTAPVGSCAFGIHVPAGWTQRSGPDGVLAVGETLTDVVICLDAP